MQGGPFLTNSRGVVPCDQADGSRNSHGFAERGPPEDKTFAFLIISQGVTGSGHLARVESS